MFISKKFFLGLLAGIFWHFSIFSSGIVYLGSEQAKQAGFISKKGEDYYVYTSQLGLLTLGSFKILNSEIKEIGPLELSSESDIARIKVDPGMLKDKAYPIAGKVLIARPVEVFSNNFSSKIQMNVIGINRHSFALNKATQKNLVGSPVFAPDKGVVGIISSGYTKFVIASHWVEGKVSLKEIANRQAARLDVPVDWVSADKINFEQAAKRVSLASNYQKDFLPLLNWWCFNPYRSIEESVKYPEELKAWVKDHNYKTKAYDIKLDRCQEDTKKKLGLINSLIDANIQRGSVLSRFPKRNISYVQMDWKTPYLNYLTKKYVREWEKIDLLMQRRLMQMVYILPHECGVDDNYKKDKNQKRKPKKKKGKKHKKKTKKKGSKKHKEPKPQYMPFEEISNSLVILQDSEGHHGLGVAVKKEKEKYVLFPQSAWKGKSIKYDLNTFSGQKLAISNFEYNKDNDYLRLQVKDNPDLAYLNLNELSKPKQENKNSKEQKENKPAKKSKKKRSKKKKPPVKPVIISRYYTIGLYDGIIYEHKPEQAKNLSVPSPMINSNKKFIGFIEKEKIQEQEISSANPLKTKSDWDPLKPYVFIKQINLIQEIQDFTKALIYTRENHGMDQFMDIDTKIHPKLIFWIKEQNEQAMAMKFKNSYEKHNSMAEALRQQKSRCLYYVSLKRLRVFHDRNTQFAQKTKWATPLLKSSADNLEKINKECSDMIETEMQQMVEEYPATKIRM